MEEEQQNTEEYMDFPGFFQTLLLENDIEIPFIEEETLEWYAMSPSKRFEESQKLWEIFEIFGGSYDPEPDTQSPFHIFTT